MKTDCSNPFAEVIESSLQGFLSQSWEWNHFPTFGSMVTISSDSRILCGIVHQIQTGSMDPVRYPFTYKKTEAELMAEQPHIFEFLKTTFNTIVIGYQEKGKIYYLSPPEPAKIHAFVHPMPPDLTKRFFASNQYLDILFGQQSAIFNLDELLLTLIKTQHQIGLINQASIIQLTSRLRLLTGNDYRRLKLLLHRVEPLLQI